MKSYLHGGEKLSIEDYPHDVEIANVRLKTKSGRLEKIRNKEKKKAIVLGIYHALLELGAIRDPRFEERPGFIRYISERKLENVPKNFSFAETGIMAWVLGKRDPEEIADYIVRQYMKMSKK